ncbi:hypothetical protein JCM12298_11880 [Desulfothermus naphthae]
MHKINFNDIEKNISQQTDKTKQKASNQDFDIFLKKQIEEKQEKMLKPQISSTPIELKELEAALRLNQNQDHIKIMDKIESTLDQWEKYSHNLSCGNLRESENTLNSLIDELTQIEKDLNSNDIDSSEGATNIVNELKIMAISERARLNRGDYT